MPDWVAQDFNVSVDGMTLIGKMLYQVYEVKKTLSRES